MSTDYEELAEEIEAAAITQIGPKLKHIAVDMPHPGEAAVYFVLTDEEDQTQLDAFAQLIEIQNRMLDDVSLSFHLEPDDGTFTRQRSVLHAYVA